MDALRGEVRKAALVDEALRLPLVPSEKNNAAPAGRRRDVASRYKSGVPPPASSTAASTARRCTSPNLSRTSAAEGTPLPKRAQSTDRRRPLTPSAASSKLTPSTLASRSNTPAHDAAMEVQSGSRRVISARSPDGLWPPMRNLSPSFQLQTGDMVEKRGPLRGKNKNMGEQRENAQPLENPYKRTIEQHLWPAMMSGGRGSVSSTSRGVSLADKASTAVSSSNPSRGLSPRRTPTFRGSGKGMNPQLNEMERRATIDGSRREDKSDSGSDVSSHIPERSKSVNRPSRTLSSPIPFVHRSSSPCKFLSAASSTHRASQSPSRSRPLTPCQSQSTAATSRSGVTPSVINYIIDARKGKKNAIQIENIHQLRLLYNRYLQWHFVNACAEDTQSFQKLDVESILYSVWKSTLKLRDAVTMRRTDVHHLRQELKLHIILKEQIAYLEQWAAVERENSSSLVGAIEALKASTLRLPVTSGAQADAVAVKNAISSAVDVMHSMSSSICYLLSKVDDRTSLVAELSVIAGQEKVMLDECRELLATVATLQVQEASLQAHLMQPIQGVVEMN